MNADELYTPDEMEIIARRCLRSFEGEATTSREDEKVRYHRTVLAMADAVRISQYRKKEVEGYLEATNKLIGLAKGKL